MANKKQASVPSRPQGRPSLYTKEIAESICSRIAAGETLKGICRDDGMPHESTVRGWALDDLHGFFAPYARARALQAHSWADDTVEISDDARNDWTRREREDGAVDFEANGEHISRSRLRVDTRKWLIAKMLPKEYGDRTEIDMTIKSAVGDMADAELDAAIEAARKARSSDNGDSRS